MIINELRTEFGLIKFKQPITSVVTEGNGCSIYTLSELNLGICVPSDVDNHRRKIEGALREIYKFGKNAEPHHDYQKKFFNLIETVI